MYIFADSHQNLNSYPTNTVYDFHLVLPKPLNIAPGNWKLGLKEIVLLRDKALEGAFLLTVDCTQPVAAHGSESSVLRAIHLSSVNSHLALCKDVLTFDNIFYMPLHTGLINVLHVQLKLLDGGPLSDIIKVWCVFHFKRN